MSELKVKTPEEMAAELERLRAENADLKKALQSGRFEPGERLREESLAAWLKVSRTPVREALRRLTAEIGNAKGEPGQHCPERAQPPEEGNDDRGEAIARRDARLKLADRADHRPGAEGRPGQLHEDVGGEVGGAFHDGCRGSCVRLGEEGRQGATVNRVTATYHREALDLATTAEQIGLDAVYNAAYAAEVIRDFTYMVVLLSVIITAVLIPLSQTPLLARLYQRIFTPAVTPVTEAPAPQG